MITNFLSNDDSWMLPCMNKTFLGMDCPGCGIQRSISLLMQGKIVDSFFMYPALFPMIFLFVFLTFDWFMKVKHGEKIKLGLVGLTLGTVFINFGIKLLTN